LNSPGKGSPGQIVWLYSRIREIDERVWERGKISNCKGLNGVFIEMIKTNVPREQPLHQLCTPDTLKSSFVI
jgi:hypothetical protein